jgi:SSS family solute:Na+ symporter
MFLFSALCVLGVFVPIGLILGRRAGQHGDFLTGGRDASTARVVGILLGALVGGASTVGTAEMAYERGLSALWFTLGGGIGCLAMGLRFAAAARRSQATTIPEILTSAYGPRTADAALIASTLGTFLSLVAQFLSGSALLRALIPVGPGVGALIAVVLVLAFIATGGISAYGALGQLKLLLLYGLLAAGAVAACRQGFTPIRLLRDLPGQPFLNPLSRGWADLGALGSLIVGVFTTQIYLMALFSARDAATARRGALVSALLMPPLGLLGTWIGVAVRSSGARIEPALALPWFLIRAFPPAVAGALYAGLLLTVVGCAAGLALGIAANLVRDVLPKVERLFPGRLRRGSPSVFRGTLLAVVLAAAIPGLGGGPSAILGWSYLSMGLRGAGTFFPLVLALLRPGRLSPDWAFRSCACGTGTTLLWAILGLPWDPLFPGLLVSGLLAFRGIGGSYRL